MTSRCHMRDEDDLLATSNISLDHYNHDIQFYGAEIPGNMKFEELKELGVVRLSILRIVGEIANKSNKKKPSKCLKDLLSKLKTLGLNSFANLFNGSGRDIHDKERLCARWRDHVSHNAARLALSQTIEGQFWLQEAEDKLVEWRLTALNENGITAFMRIHDIQYPMVDEHEKKTLKTHLIISMDKPDTFNRAIFYKVPYLEALDAIGNGRVHLVSGVAYLTTSMLRSVIAYRFHCHLKKEIKKSLNATHRQRDDPRVRDLIYHLQKVHESFKTTYSKTKTQTKDLDQLAVKSYPPCMRKLHEALRNKHHLRNQGRVQYTLFLKAIGVSAEGAVELFQKEFTQKMDEQQFEKEYTYYIRHLYGLVGAKRNYKIFDCAKVAEFPASDDEYHGCPFTQDDIEDLGNMLSRWEIPSNRKKEISKLTRSKQFSKACSAYFEETHGCCINSSFVNPMDFYSQSIQICDPR